VTIEGWLLDVYPAPGKGLAVWVIPTAGGKRLCLHMPFPVTFCAAGPPDRLRQLWLYLRRHAPALRLSRQQRRDLFLPEPVTVLVAEAPDPAIQPQLFALAAAVFPDLTWYDADLPPWLRFTAHCGAFPNAHLRLHVDAHNTVQHIETLSSRWELDPQPPPLRVMRLSPDCDPRRSDPSSINVHMDAFGSPQHRSCRFSLEPARALLVNLRALLDRYDPDLLLTCWGDTWLLPRLLELSDELGLPLPLNRDPEAEIIYRDERSYHAYGQVIYRGRQVLLAGRWHIDQYNAMMFHDYGLDGILESARVTCTPVQAAARQSPGSGISAMQMIVALQRGILVPWHKQQPEDARGTDELVRADQGGLVYQPVIGLHRDVAEFDFVSMYPGIMAHFNVSPETIGPPRPEAERVPELDLWVDTRHDGLVPETLRPLLAKRIAFKTRAAELPAWDPRRPLYKARAAAHKWLLVTCFGYLGYKNARFGRIEAHQAVTAYSRECLLRAKEVVEDAGCEVLHMYVDGLWVGACPQGHGFHTVQEVQPLLDEIARRTRLPIALDGIYRWVVFLPSRQDARIPVANRYFGVFQDGSIKMRGIEARRGDTPPFIAALQTGILERLARAPTADDLPACLPEIAAFLHREYLRLRRRELPLETLLVTQKVSREVAHYRTPSPVARAALQLIEAGKPVRPGQSVRFLYVLGGKPGVQAWDTWAVPGPQRVDIAMYARLLRRACLSVLGPFGVGEPGLRRCLEEGVLSALTYQPWMLEAIPVAILAPALFAAPLPV